MCNDDWSSRCASVVRVCSDSQTSGIGSERTIRSLISSELKFPRLRFQPFFLVAAAEAPAKAMAVLLMFPVTRVFLSFTIPLSSINSHK